MKTLTKNMVLFVLFSLSTCQYIHAQDIEPPKRDLQFVTSDESEVLDPAINEFLKNRLPTHIAILTIPTNGPGFGSFNNKAINITQIFMGSSTGRGGGYILNRYIFKDNVSSKKIEFLFFSPNRNYTYYILANSEQQAREYAKIFIKGYDTGTYNSLKELKDDLELNREIMREGETKISKMEAEQKELEEQKNKLYKEYAKVNYLTEGTIPEVNDIIKVKEEMAHYLRDVDFELVGLDAKVESINKYKLSGTIIDDETLIKLNQILMATDIDRAGVLARKHAFEASFKQANQLYNLISNSKKALYELIEYKHKFTNAPESVSNLEMLLNNPRQPYTYVVVEDNKVVIKPVKQD